MVHHFSKFEIDEDKRELRSGRRVLSLQPRVFNLLVYLARNRERVVPKDELLDSVWPGVIVTDGSLQRAVSIARLALEKTGAKRSIQTFPRQGYRLLDASAPRTPQAKPAVSVAPTRPRQPTPDEKRMVLAHVDSIGRLPLFRGADRLHSLLRFLVSEELAGRGAALTPESVARAIGKTGSSREPGTAAAVRADAGELRDRLRTHYATAGAEPPVRIDLPGGRIAPRFIVRGRALDDRDELPKQEILFAKSADGTSLAYSVSGLGYPLIKAANWLSHIEYDYTSPVWRHWWQGLAERFQLVRYDERGCGLSDWNVSDFSVDVWAEDLEAIANQTGHRKYALLGISQGAAVAIAHAVKHPDRVSHLVLYGGFVQGMMRRKLTLQQSKEGLMLLALTRIGWGRRSSVFTRVFSSLFLPDGTREQHANFLELQRVSCTPDNAERFMRTFGVIDVAELAKQVRVPTLVLHGRNDHVVPLEQARLIARTIPGARLVLLDSGNHILGEKDPAWPEFLNEIASFVH